MSTLDSRTTDLRWYIQQLKERPGHQKFPYPHSSLEDMVLALDMAGTWGVGGLIRVWILGRGEQTATWVRTVGQEREWEQACEGQRSVYVPLSCFQKLWRSRWGDSEHKDGKLTSLLFLHVTSLSLKSNQVFVAYRLCVMHRIRHFYSII